MKNRASPGQLELFANAPQQHKRKVAQPPPAVKRVIHTAEGGCATFEHLAEVAFEGPVHGTFTYLADFVWRELKPGVRVLVPFGRRAAPGFFLGERSLAELSREKVEAARLKPAHAACEHRSKTVPHPLL